MHQADFSGNPGRNPRRLRHRNPAREQPLGGVGTLRGRPATNRKHAVQAASYGRGESLELVAVFPLGRSSFLRKSATCFAETGGARLPQLLRT